MPPRKPTDADRLRSQLARLGMSQRGLARELDLDERTVRRYCAGETPVPTVVWLAIEALLAREGKAAPAAPIVFPPPSGDWGTITDSTLGTIDPPITIRREPKP